MSRYRMQPFTIGAESVGGTALVLRSPTALTLSESSLLPDADETPGER